MAQHLVRLAVLFVALAGCYTAAPAIGVPCAADQTCPGGQFCDLARDPPLCVTSALDAAIDSAVACTVGSSNGCPVEAPICDPSTMTCRRCVADADCDSNACYESLGTCVEAALVLWVDGEAGDDTGTCTEALPCATIARAVGLADATRSFIRLAPANYRQPVTINRSVILSGTARGAATALSNPGFGPAVTINGATTVVTAETLQVTASPGPGFDVNNSATFHLFGAVVDGVSIGVSAQAATVEVRQSTITNTNRAIEAVNGSSLLVHRCTLSENNDHFIRVAGSGYTITSSLFVDNRRGFAVDGTVIAGSRFDHNTIVGTQNDFAMRCGNPGPVISNSILANNQTPSIDPNRCTVRYTLATDTLLPGTGNLTGDPGFVAPADFHLGAMSRAVDAADPQSTEPFDLDGNQRPHGPRRDLGAYER